jgi:hypothetical protein
MLSRRIFFQKAERFSFYRCDSRHFHTRNLNIEFSGRVIKQENRSAILPAQKQAPTCQTAVSSSPDSSKHRVRGYTYPHRIGNITAVSQAL